MNANSFPGNLCGNRRAAAIAAFWAGLAALGPRASGAEELPESADAAVEALTVDAPAGNLYFRTDWNPAAGMRLLFESGTNGAPAATVELELGSEGPLLSWTRHTDAAEEYAGANRMRGRPAALPDRPMEDVEWLLKFRARDWLLYCDDRLAAWFPAPFQAPLTIAFRRGGRPARDLPREPFFQRIEPLLFSDDFMIPETEEDAGIGEWTAVTGAWRVHTVLDEAPGARRGNRVPEAERSPNFYSLKGMGTNAVAVAGYDFHDDYRHSAAVELQVGEMGLVFYHNEVTGDYYAFTLALDSGDDGVAQAALWRTVAGDPDRRAFLAAARIPLMFPGQWVRLETVAHHDRVVARLDGHTVFDLDHDLPGGGAFGVFADAGREVLFDNVRTTSRRELDLRDRERILFHKTAAAGDFFPDPPSSFWSWLPWRGTETKSSARLRPAPSGTDRWLALGSPRDSGQVVSAVFHPETPDYEIGLVAGVGKTAPSAAHLRFTLQRQGDTESFRLFEIDARGATVPLERFRKRTSRPAGQPVRLMLDMSAGRRIRCYRDGVLVLIHETDTPPSGAAGPLVGAGGEATVGDLAYAFERDDLWTSSREKNPVFMEDPFMRHWSSPEGEWYADDRGLTWHKSDFFGRFEVTLPVVENGAAHFGVPEGATNGALIVRLRNGVASLYVSESDGLPPRRALSAELETSRADASAPPLFSARYEDHWFYLVAGDDRTVLRRALAEPLTGTRVRIEGFSVDDLASGEVIRHRVQDHLFTQAPSDWRFNGGEWRVINRFDCDPRWSHMNAESADGLAAAWSKRAFAGDFSVEMYAGMRHNWYRRVGDMNLTVMSRDGTPSQGYTLTCTGWDPDHSQLDTIFYRDGAVFDRTDAYLAPRWRAGNRRRRLEDVLRAGRDVHGAWYYIKLRRIGNRLEYYFDNELIFAREDDASIDAGRVGIWTFMNSIMIARVSISARERVETPLEFEPVPVELAARPRLRATAADTPAAAAAVPEETPWPRPYMHPAYWEADDPVGRSRLDWHRDDRQGDYFTLTTRLGGGPMFARAGSPPRPYRELAGWQFLVKRTARANFNAYYSMGRLDGNGEYKPLRNFFHRISGGDFDRGEWRMTGGNAVPGTAGAHTPDWHALGRWRRVEIRLPAADPVVSLHDDNLLVRFEGFGVLQPGYETQGLSGNGPGEAYAIARFAPVWLGAPFAAAVTNAAEFADTAQYRLYGDAARKRFLAQGDGASMAAAMLERDNAGANVFAIDSIDPQPGYPLDLAWRRPDAEATVGIEWCREEPDSAILYSPVAWPERRLAQAAVQLADRRLPLHESGFNRWRVDLPPLDDAAGATNGGIVLTLSMPSQPPRTLGLDPADPARRARGPVLTRLEGFTPLFVNFESLGFGPLARVDRRRMRVRRDPATGGACLEVANHALGQRLRADLAAAVCLARYPLLQFRYRGDRMSLLSINVHNRMVRLNEPLANAAEVRFASPFVNDGDWHTWSGMISEVVESAIFNPAMYTIGQLGFGSFHRIDQTGAFSRWALDYLALGPAAARAEQLTFTPYFGGVLPVASVEMGLLAGLEPVDANAPPENVDWRTITNAMPVTPDIAGLPDGAAQLLLRAVDTAGNRGAAAAIPFLLDRSPPRVNAVLESNRDPPGEGSLLRIDFDTGDGSPILPEPLRLSFNGQSVPEMDPFLSTAVLRAPGLRVHLNWPFLLRQFIQAHSSGEPAVLRLEGLRDGAGNRAADIEIPLNVPDGDDNDGPAFLPALYPEAVLFATAWEGRSEPPDYFQAGRGERIEVKREWGGEPWLTSRARGSGGTLTLAFEDTVWRPSEYPYLAFRVRQPDADEDSRTRIALSVTLDNDAVVNVALNPAAARGGGDNMLTPPFPLERQPDRWYPAILDLEELLRERAEIADPGRRRIKSLAFRRSRAQNNEPFDIQSVFVFRPWKAGEFVTIDGYDRSGVDGWEWEFLDAHDRADGGAREAREPPDGKAAGWLLIRLRDRLDNLSAPLRIPLVFAGGEKEPPPFRQRVESAVRSAVP